MFRFFSWFHYTSAIVLFICMALLALLCSKTTLNDERLIPALGEQAPTWADDYPKSSSFFIAWFPLLAISHPVFPEKVADAKRYIRAEL